MTYYVLMIFLFASDGQLIESFAQDQYKSEQACHGKYYDDIKPFYEEQMKFGRIQSLENYKFAEKVDHACVGVTIP